MSLIPTFKIGLWNAWIFMCVFLLQMLVIMFVDNRIMEKSHVPKEARTNRTERYVGILGNLIWMITMVYSVFLPLRLGTVWFYVGVSVFLIGLLLLIVATFNFITTPVDQMITNGVYRFSRHPMYLATFLITLGAGIASASWLFILLCIMLGLCFRLEALVEEKFCLAKYNNVYRQYLNRGPRWLGLRGSNDN